MKQKPFTLLFGDCLTVLRTLDSGSVDLFYIDPPFLTQKIHALTTRDGSARFSFEDLWSSREDYGDFIIDRLRECHRCLKSTGSLFFHCDENAGHIARLVLDQVFGPDSLQSEIIWSFRRWSNSRRGLMPSHQTILFYSRSKAFKFNTVMTPYSEATNIDQILQKRVRDKRGKAIYARDDAGELMTNGAKRGVPLGDVWEIPYLNPKARERVGYPTQKPVLLMERIIALCTDPDDIVVDPFCGSGTTLVAAQLLRRRAIGIDSSQKALDLAEQRLRNPIKSQSRLLEHGRESYVRRDLELLECLKGLSYHPVHRNKGIDAILAEECSGKPVCIRVQRPHETVEDAATALCNAAEGKGGAKLILVVTQPQWESLGKQNLPPAVSLVHSTTAVIRSCLSGQSHEIEVSSDQRRGVGGAGCSTLTRGTDESRSRKPDEYRVKE